MVLSQSRGAWTPGRQLAPSPRRAPASCCHRLPVARRAHAWRSGPPGERSGAAGSSSSHPVIASESGGSWGPAVQVALPAGVSGAQNATFSSVACPALRSRARRSGTTSSKRSASSPPAELGHRRQRVRRRVGRAPARSALHRRWAVPAERSSNPSRARLRARVRRSAHTKTATATSSDRARRERAGCGARRARSRAPANAGRRGEHLTRSRRLPGSRLLRGGRAIRRSRAARWRRWQ